MLSDSIFRLFANCLPVKGAIRSTICDLQLGRFDFIPNGLYHILTEMKGLTIVEIKASFHDNQHKIIDDYFAFLEHARYGFFCSEPNLFPDLDLTWDAPGQITNAIIDINEESNHPFGSIFTQLDCLGCKALQIRIFTPMSPEELRRILDLTRRGGLRHIDLLLAYSGEFTGDLLEGICSEHQRVSKIVVHSAPDERVIKVGNTNVQISFTTAQCDSPSCCGETSPRYFAVNIELFTEAQSWNTCLNRKISISTDGLIKNCPSMSDSFGHITTTPLNAALTAPMYKRLWSITKDQVKICRDCEFRYICTDCRAYREDPSDIASKPLKCGYNPYTAEWSEPAGKGRSSVSNGDTKS